MAVSTPRESVTRLPSYLEGALRGMTSRSPVDHKTKRGEGDASTPSSATPPGPKPPPSGERASAYAEGTPVSFDEVPGEKGMYLARLGDVSLKMSARFDDGAPRVRDIDLAQWLCYARPAKIRDIIKRMMSAGKLSDIHQIPTVGKRAGQVAAQGVTEFWLTRKQALLVTSQAGTARAWEITNIMVDVFEAFLDRFAHRGGPGLSEADVVRIVAQVIDARLSTWFDSRLDAIVESVVRRLTPAQHHLPGLDNESAATILRLSNRLERLESAFSSGIIGPVEAKALKARLRKAAQDKAKATGKKTTGVLRGWMNRIEKTTGFAGENSGLENLPRALLHVVERLVGGFEKEADRASAVAAKAKAAAGASGQTHLKLA